MPKIHFERRPVNSRLLWRSTRMEFADLTIMCWTSWTCFLFSQWKVMQETCPNFAGSLYADAFRRLRALSQDDEDALLLRTWLSRSALIKIWFEKIWPACWTDSEQGQCMNVCNMNSFYILYISTCRYHYIPFASFCQQLHTSLGQDTFRRTLQDIKRKNANMLFHVVRTACRRACLERSPSFNIWQGCPCSTD